MKVLAFEPYYGGSHRSFVDGWRERSRHGWKLWTLPPRKWKWRMRHSALTWAAQAQEAVDAGRRWDVVWCSDMLNLAEFRSLAPPSVGRLPAVVYFHENQLTYPVRFEKERDYQFGLTNITSALAADEAWFNSAFHRDEFLAAIPAFLKRMPDHRPLEVVEKIAARSRVLPPAVEPAEPASGPRETGPLRVVWAARWEFDKAPEVLFAAVRRLVERGVDLRLSVLGESFEEVPPEFEEARRDLEPVLEHWGYLEDRAAYRRCLAAADVFVSTAIHEFFGLAAVEAILHGARPLLPRRLAYPELLDLERHPERDRYCYDGSESQLAARLEELAQAVAAGIDVRDAELDGVRRRLEEATWPVAAARLDDALERVAAREL